MSRVCNVNVLSQEHQNWSVESRGGGHLLLVAEILPPFCRPILQNSECWSFLHAHSPVSPPADRPENPRDTQQRTHFDTMPLLRARRPSDYPSLLLYVLDEVIAFSAFTSRAFLSYVHLLFSLPSLSEGFYEILQRHMILPHSPRCSSSFLPLFLNLALSVNL